MVLLIQLVGCKKMVFLRLPNLNFQVLDVSLFPFAEVSLSKPVLFFAFDLDFFVVLLVKRKVRIHTLHNVRYPYFQVSFMGVIAVPDRRACI